MNKLLVNTPTGEQRIEYGVRYFDESRVLWNESVDGPMPSVILNGMERVGKRLVLNQAKLDAYSPPAPPPPRINIASVLNSKSEAQKQRIIDFLEGV